MRQLVCVTASIGLVFALSARSGAAAEASAPDRLADLSWMAGSWASDQGGRTSEEHWTGPAGGLMLGLHRDTGGGEWRKKISPTLDRRDKHSGRDCKQGRQRSSQEENDPPDARKHKVGAR